GQRLDRAFEQGLVGRTQATGLGGGGLRESRVGAAAAPALDFARRLDPGADRRATFAGRRVRPQFRGRQARYLDVQVDAVEQRAGDPRAVALDLVGGAAAASGQVAG